MKAINNTIFFEDERVDGADKVTGKAKYTAEHSLPNMAYAVFVTSTIAKGSIKNLDITKALTMPGVIDIIYYANCPAVPGYNPNAAERPKNVSEWRGYKVLYDNKVRFFGQPIALILANSFENANAAIRFVKAEYEIEKFETNFDKARLDPANLKAPINYKRGTEKKYKEQPFFVEGEYNIPIEVHNAMELFATIAYWEGDDKITLYDKTQGPKSTQSTVARTFGLVDKNVRVIAENVGGGFGSGLRSWPHVAAACIAAKKINRPVKLVLTRPQMFSMVGYRPQSWQKVGIGADAAGNFIGISHEAISNTSRYEDFREGIVEASKFLYACENVDTKYSILPLDVSTPIWMRGPGEATGCFALESAIDELSYKLKMDPIQLRIKNFTAVNPENKLPFSDINIKDCYAYGMEKIGWKNRPTIPGSLKENGMLIGYGMSVGVFGAGKGAASVRIVLSNDGKLLLECAVSDMGPGTMTSMSIIASDAMQMPIQKIKFKLGDSDLPPGPSQGGSGTTSTVGSAVDLACKTLQQKLKEMAIQFVPAFAGSTADAIEVKNEMVISKTNATTKIDIPVLLKLANQEKIDLTIASNGKTAAQLKFTSNSFSSHFVKLAVNPKDGTIKILNVVTTGDAGKIISPKTARSQMIGGVVGGIGMALTEKLEFDHATGQITNASFGAYHVPLHSQIPPTDVWFVDKPDVNMNEIGAKGIGEIALIGFAAAVANAVYNATGKRVRDLPITPEKLGYKTVKA
ncbi:MAG: xanthine dehydrogenase family protein molybdopterin-binding subunit [Chitinophagia bacterium]|nr:xanthine dehydrogenase family protein molybdopterin-binding subunit [Chitinophagia bacterium]NCA29822.1 xanthine dehydrogenase family protein molybdopterin-binding subunit [Chitinophagia bacterium]